MKNKFLSKFRDQNSILLRIFTIKTNSKERQEKKESERRRPLLQLQQNETGGGKRKRWVGTHSHN